MDKKLVIINGPMGVGKSTVCEALHRRIDRSFWLDGDWCWKMNPFTVNSAGKQMVLDNICHMLGNFLGYPDYHTIIFNWVIPQEEIFEMILRPLQDRGEFTVLKITLMASETRLRSRVRKDIAAGTRDDDSLQRSLDYLPLYQTMNTIKINTDDLTVPETVDRLMRVIVEHPRK